MNKTARNSVTGDRIRTGANSDAYRNNKFFDRKAHKQAEDEQKDILYKELPTKTELDEKIAKLTAYLKHT